MLPTAAALAALLAAAPAVAWEALPLPPVATPVGQVPDSPLSPSAPARDTARTNPPRPATQPIPRGAVLEEVSGVLEGFDRQEHRLRVGTAAGPVTLSVDRNTMVYTPAGLGTVADLVPGSQLRAGRNAEALAYWVQVRRPAKEGEPTSTPGQGTGPGGGAGAPAEGGAAGGAGMPPSGVGPGGVGPSTAPGTGTPER
ncbi:MAG TPA: hypothetical protein VLC54_02475 [Anaeromyxobacter sp.]|nr:hypothetical protein [Anaeromyxobacter sp.]